MARYLFPLLVLAPLVTLVAEFTRGGAAPLLIGLAAWWLLSARVAA